MTTVGLAGCHHTPAGGAASALEAAASADGGTADRAGAELTGKALLGERLFQDATLSASGTQSCASCHDAERAFQGNNRPDDPFFPVALGTLPALVGARNVPTAMYMEFSPPFSFVEEDDELTPTGGQFWDGRADSLAQQAAGPFLNPLEMAMPSKQAVIERVREASYADLFLSVFGDDALDDADKAYDDVTLAIEAFEKSARLRPFSSKFDAVLRGEASFDEHERAGFELFKDPEKGNCISCHVGDPDSDRSEDWLFTDFTYDNLGVPRNTQIPANADPAHYDLGLCKQPGIEQRVPAKVDDPQAFVASLCGAFKVPTLRNVAKTAPYMHNGYFSGLRDVVEFYVTREVSPERWYPRDDEGRVVKWNDLPERYASNVNTTEVPYDRKPGEPPRLSAAEIDDIVAFLRTLSDGHPAP